MHREHHKWHSHNLGQDMELFVYGHKGVPFIVFPSSSGRFFNYEDFGMIQALADYINDCKIKLFAIDGIDQQTWFNYSLLPGDRNHRHNAYDRYVASEVVPFVQNHCHNQNVNIYTTGCSMGAFHSMNFFLRHPDIIHGVIAQSGLYRLDRAQFNIQSGDIPYVYYNSPLNYLANLEDQETLACLRKSKVIVSVGQGNWEDEMIADTNALKEIFEAKKIPAWFDYWGHDVEHHWYWWQKQIHYFMPHFFSP